MQDQTTRSFGHVTLDKVFKEPEASPHTKRNNRAPCQSCFVGKKSDHLHEVWKTLKQYTNIDLHCYLLPLSQLLSDNFMISPWPCWLPSSAQTQRGCSYQLIGIVELLKAQEKKKQRKMCKRPQSSRVNAAVSPHQENKEAGGAGHFS